MLISQEHFTVSFLHICLHFLLVHNAVLAQYMVSSLSAYSSDSYMSVFCQNSKMCHHSHIDSLCKWDFSYNNTPIMTTFWPTWHVAWTVCDRRAFLLHFLKPKLNPQTF